MTQILDSLLLSMTRRICCGYLNATGLNPNYSDCQYTQLVL